MHVLTHYVWFVVLLIKVDSWGFLDFWQHTTGANSTEVRKRRKQKLVLLTFRLNMGNKNRNRCKIIYFTNFERLYLSYLEDNSELNLIAGIQTSCANFGR